LPAGIAYGLAPSTSIAQHLAEQRRQARAVAERIALAAAVAEPELEKLVGTEREPAPVVVREGLVDEEHIASPRRGNVGVPRDASV
jgi:hypothetical protein